MGVISTNNQLLIAYLQTTFELEGSIRFNLTEPSEDLRAFLKDKTVKTWAIITADNPLSRTKSAADNDKAHKRLKDYLTTKPFTFYDCNSLPSSKEHAGERGFLVANLSKSTAGAIGRLFHQNAIVFGYRDGQAEISWCMPGYLTSDSQASHEENFFWTQVVPCIHGLECTTGCTDNFASLLKEEGLTSEACQFLVAKWRECGPPTSFSKTIDRDPLKAVREADLSYKDLVVSRLRLLETKNDLP